MADKTDKRLALEARAEELGLKVPAKTGIEKLAESIAAAEAAGAGQTLRVIGPKKGRWRAGRHFGAEPVSIPLADLSEAEIAALESDPVLTVAIVPGDLE